MFSSLPLELLAAKSIFIVCCWVEFIRRIWLWCPSELDTFKCSVDYSLIILALVLFLCLLFFLLLMSVLFMFECLKELLKENLWHFHYVHRGALLWYLDHKWTDTYNTQLLAHLLVNTCFHNISLCCFFFPPLISLVFIIEIMLCTWWKCMSLDYAYILH